MSPEQWVLQRWSLATMGGMGTLAWGSAAHSVGILQRDVLASQGVPLIKRREK